MPPPLELDDVAVVLTELVVTLVLDAELELDLLDDELDVVASPPSPPLPPLPPSSPQA